MDHTDNHQVRKAEPELDIHADVAGAAPHPSAAPVEDLPPWLQPGAATPPERPLTRPLYAWGGTLAATALMVAFGLWLGDEQEPLAQQIAATPSAPAPVLEARNSGVVPPLVMLPAATPAAAPAAAPLGQTNVRAEKLKPQGRAVAVVKKPVVAKRRTTMLAATAQGRPRASATSAAPRERWSGNRIAALDNAPRMRCKRGELARECLARYR